MNTQLAAKKWTGVTLLVALLSLLAVGSLNALEAKASAVAAGVPCNIAEMDSSLSPSSTGLSLVCEGAEMLQVHGVEYGGDFAVIQVVVGGEVESGLYMQTDTGWERVELVVASSDELAYVSELEDASAGETSGPESFSAAPTIRTDGRAWAVQGEAFEGYLSELENASAGETSGPGSLNPAPVIRTDGRTWAVQGEAFEGYLSELESASAGETSGPESFNPAPVIRTDGRTWAVQGEAFEGYLRDLEDAWAEGR